MKGSRFEDRHGKTGNGYPLVLLGILVISLQPPPAQVEK